MTELGAISQNMLTLKQTQMSLIKQNFEMQEKVVEILEDSRETTSLSVGQNVDKTL